MFLLLLPVPSSKPSLLCLAWLVTSVTKLHGADGWPWCPGWCWCGWRRSVLVWRCVAFSFLGGTVVVKTWRKKRPHDRVRGFAKVHDETLDDVLCNERTDSQLWDVCRACASEIREDAWLIFPPGVKPRGVLQGYDQLVNVSWIQGLVQGLGRFGVCDTNFDILFAVLRRS